MQLLFSRVLILSVLSHTLLFCQNSEELWKTKFEITNFLETPSYMESIDYFVKLADSSRLAEIFSFGISPQGRDLYAVIVSKEKIFSPSSLNKRKKPLLMIVNGIHSGEIEGKDAAMILLREILITKEKEYFLDKADLLIIPVFNADGHERFSPYNRINQNGPAEMGWRTTSQNLNLNRDWTKADAPEMQALLKLFSDWLPDFLIDSHTTNGADYQYDVTYGVEKNQNIYSGTGEWIRSRFIPFMEKYIDDAGFLTMPYIELKDWNAGLESGIVNGAFGARYSQGYAAVQNRPGLLIETHMLKPYKERVFSTKAMFESVILLLNEDSEKIIELNKAADKNSVKLFRKEKKYFPLNLDVNNEYEIINFKGIEFVKDTSEISGGIRISYTGKNKEYELKNYSNVIVTDSITAPSAYLIPPQWKDAVDRLKLHGIEINRLDKDTVLKVTRYKFKDIEFAKASFEGRQRVSCGYDEFIEEALVPKGTYIITTNQRTISVILHLLEPKSPDSFLKWGFFNTIFERKEYFESYVMEKLAKKMLSEDSKLKDEFELKLNDDEKFRNSPRERLNFFYERSPYFDKEWNLYPVMRIE